MKRSLAALVSLSLIVVSAPPVSWGQVMSAATAGSSASGVSAAGASVNAGRIPSLSLPSALLSGPSLNGALSAPMAAGMPAPIAGVPVLNPFAPADARAALAIPLPRVSESGLAAASVADKPAPKGAALTPVQATPESLAQARREVAEAAGAIEKGDDSSSRSAATRMMDRLLGLEESGDREPAVEGLPRAGILASGLSPSGAESEAAFSGGVPTPGAPAPAPQRRTKLGGFLKSAGAMVVGAGAVLGLQAAAVALFPAIFGVLPIAAVWAVSSGLLLFPLALYARWRLAKRDSPRLNKVKTIMDLALGAFAGAVLVALPSLGVVLTTAGVLTAAMPLAAVAGGRWIGATGFADAALVWAVLGLTPALVGAASVAGVIGLAPIIGMMALPVMTTIAFFLGRLIHAAETGQPFAVPGSMQRIRFPSFQWVMIGVVFALLTGYSAVYTNVAFLAWTLLGGRSGNAAQPARPFKFSIMAILKKILSVITFDRLYLGLFVWTAITGFSSPLTFLVIAFAGERASIWIERLLAKVLPKGAAAPSTKAKPVADPEMLAEREPKWPAFHYWAKTFLLVGSMAAGGFLLASTVFGITSLLTNLGIAGALAFIPFFFAKKIIKLLMKAEPTTRERDPEFFAIMEELRDKINAKRRAAGKKEIPMPEMVIDPMLAPNAYATGRSPFAAMVGVTRGIKAMTLDPENVRDGVVRLIASSDPGTKEFKVFRRAVAGSVTGIPAEATPAQVASAVLAAPRSELKALGVRMLRGVLGHEFSHVMDRHMLSGSIAGSIASGVAFASYGVMWAVGHAQVAVQKLFGGKPKAETEAPVRPNGGTGVRPEAVDPISTGVVIKSLPALIKLFAALWAPVAMQVLQMAASRNNEGMADEDGALLTEDPESLALGLGLLTTWRPPSGFRLPGATLPRAASLQHIMIVNPLEQLEGAGALPKSEAAGGPSRADDVVFELFITHPNTGVRIRKLHDMSEALRGLRRAKPNPPDGGGGGGSPPLTFRRNSASESNGGGLLRGAWRKLTGFLRVLPDEGRNRQFWIWTAGQALIALGVGFHYTALPKLVAPTKEDSAKLGYNRAVNWGAQAAASLVTGPIVDRASTQKVVVWTNILRSLLMMSVPILFFTGTFSFVVFTAVLATAGFLQLAGMTAGSVAFNRILADDVAHYNRANAISTIVMNAVGVVGPLLAGAFIATVGGWWGGLSGNALAYAVYGVLLLAAAIGYALKLRLPRDEIMAARRDLAALLKRDGTGPVRFAGVTGGTHEGRAILLVEVDGDPALAQGVPAEFGGFMVRAVARRRVLAELGQGFKTIFSDKFLRIYLLSTTLSVMSSDALVFAALPRFLEDVLKAGAGSFGLFLAAASLGAGLGSGFMAILRDPAQMALAPAAREFRAVLSARDPGLDAVRLDAAALALKESVPAVLARYKKDGLAGQGSFADQVLVEAARGVAAALAISETEAAALLTAAGTAGHVRTWAAARGAKLAARALEQGRGGMDRLQRQGRWTSWVHGLSWLVYAAVFFVPSVPAAAGLMLVSAILAGPAMVAWTSLTTKVVQGSYEQSQGKIYAAMFFYQLLFAIGGVLFYGWLMALLPTMTVLFIAAGVMVLCALIDFITPSYIFPLGKRPK